MSMGAGGIINDVAGPIKAILSNPVVHGSLPITTQTAIDPILAKECVDWDATDKQTMANAIMWALCNLP
jgi:hypothetical protein